jgi:hypothetical protein
MRARRPTLSALRLCGGAVAVAALAACSGGSSPAGPSASTDSELTLPGPTGPVGATTLTAVTATATVTTATAGGAASGAGAGRAALGVGANLHGWRPLPASNPWNTRVDTAPVDPRSAQLIASIGAAGHLHPDFGADWNGGPFGIPYVVIAGTQARVPVSFTYADESDPGPYPIPANAPIEGGPGSDGDRHVIVIDRDHGRLYELYGARPLAGGAWRAGSGAVFDLVTGATRPAGWTSADAAGLPIFPGLVRYDEVAAGRIDHALRFTVARSRRAYVAPARHQAGSTTDPNLPPMGMRVRLKASFDLSGYPPQARVILQALKTYGMFVADNGSSWYLSGAPDARWDDDRLGTLKQVPGSAFEVVAMGPVTTG